MFPEISIIILALLTKYKNNNNYNSILAGSIIIIFIGVLAKSLMKNFSNVLPRYVLYRPKGAFGCNGSTKVCCQNEVGMPSIHSMIAGYYAAKSKNPLFILPALSRLGKNENPLFYHSVSGCHTFPQITIGFITGLILSKYI